METYVFFFVASIVAGAVNALAGGGGLITFPLLMLVLAPVTADALDAHPFTYPPRADLAEFVALRDRHPTCPTAGPTSAAAADLDHLTSERDGGPSTKDNLHSPTRRWHVLKTHAGWTVSRTGRGWTWTSPAGRHYFIEPYDYRLGP